MSEKIRSFFFWILASLILIEFSLHMFYGSPKKHLMKNISKKTFYNEIEPFIKHFKKVKTENGEWLYVSQKRCPRNFFVQKSISTKRIFIIGESIAEQYGNSSEQLEKMFKSQLPQYNFEVINCGQGGYESTRIFLTFKEIINYSPDLIILMIGNNIDQKPIKFNHFTVFLYLNSWYYYTIKNIFIKKQKDLSYEKKILLYHKNLLKILSICNKKNIPITFFTVPINIKYNSIGQIPFNNKNFFLGKIAFEKGDFKKAKMLFNKVYNEPLINHYLTKIFEQEKKVDLAKKYYLKYYPAKHVIYFNKFLKQTFKNKNYKGYLLIDLNKMFEDISPNNLPGSNIFYDNCHWFKEWDEMVSYEIIENIYLHNKNYQDIIIAPVEEWKFNLKKPNVAKIINKIYDKKNDYLEQIFYTLILNFHDSQKNKKTFFYEQSFLNSVQPYYPWISKKSFTIDKLKKILWIVYNRGMNEYSCISQPIRNFMNEFVSFSFYALAEMYRVNKQYSLALKYFNESIKIDPENIYPYLLRGLTYYNIKNYKKAKQDWEKVIKKDKKFYWLKELLYLD